jgi:hypothetical protein
MSQKVAYLWGPLGSFAGPLAAALVVKGWHVHVATKSALNILSLSPLDLQSSALAILEEALGGRDRFRTFQDRLKLVDEADAPRSTNYDAFIFCGLPPNYDESRVPRAPWSADRLPALMKALKGTPTFLVSSVWGGIQQDKVVPEEVEFARRRPNSHWEGLCQHYENKMLENLSSVESPWYLVRIPMVASDSLSGQSVNFSGPNQLFKALWDASESDNKKSNSHANNSESLKLQHNPDGVFWFLPVDAAINMFLKFLEDENRPRICNLVSTQVILNREWLQSLAQALGYQEVQPVENDGLNLPGTLRKLLLDDIQIRTRNLFEVAGRYQLIPVKLDKDYFVRIFEVAREKRWGRPIAAASKRELLTFSERLAQFYFENYLPSKFSDSFLKKATTGGITIGFLLKGRDNLGWVLQTSSDGKTMVEGYNPHVKPTICFRFTGATMTKLIQSRLPLHRALLMREVEVDGPLLDALRVTNVFDKFLRENPMHAVDFAEVAGS